MAATKEETTPKDQLAAEYEEYQAKGRIWGDVPREYIKKLKFPRVDKKIIDQFLALDDLTGTISDVLDSIGLNGVIPASYLKPLIPGAKMAGTAITVRSIPERKTATQGLHDRDFIRMATRDGNYLAEPGDVFVADFGGDPGVSNYGAQAIDVAKGCGIVGGIFNGAVRDIPAFTDRNFPAWVVGRTPITGKCRMQAIEINGPLNVQGVLVEPGDLIVADDSGVCVIPPDRVEYVLGKCKSIIGEEATMRDLIEKNISIDELKPLYRKRYK